MVILRLYSASPSGSTPASPVTPYAASHRRVTSSHGMIAPFAPASIIMLQSVARLSKLMSATASPPNSMHW